MIKTRAIVLHRFPYSDSSFIIKALTEESGIVSFIVKGGKRKESPFRGALDPLALSEVVFRQNPNADLQFIKEATLLDWHKDLRNDLLNLAKAQVMAEMILRYAPQGVPLQEEFERLEQAIYELDKASVRTSDTNSDAAVTLNSSSGARSAPNIIGNVADLPNSGCVAPTPSTMQKSRIFAEWLLDTCDIWGYNLDLTICCRCGRTLEKPAADFFPETGGFVCQSCLGVERPRAKAETLNGLWVLHTGDKIEHPEFTENALLAYLRHHIGFLKEIHSIKFLNETRKLFGQ